MRNSEKVPFFPKMALKIPTWQPLRGQTPLFWKAPPRVFLQFDLGFSALPHPYCTTTPRQHVQLFGTRITCLFPRKCAMLCAQEKLHFQVSQEYYVSVDIPLRRNLHQPNSEDEEVSGSPPCFPPPSRVINWHCFLPPISQKEFDFFSWNHFQLLLRRNSQDQGDCEKKFCAYNMRNSQQSPV